MQIFSLQLYVHFVPLSEGIVASRIYFGFFALSYGMLCVMLAVGLRQRWAALSVRRRRAGVQAGLRIVGTVAGCALGDLLSIHLVTPICVVRTNGEIVATFPWAILIFTVIGTIAGFAAGRLAPRPCRESTRPKRQRSCSVGRIRISLIAMWRARVTT